MRSQCADRRTDRHQGAEAEGDSELDQRPRCSPNDDTRHGLADIDIDLRRCRNGYWADAARTFQTMAAAVSSAVVGYS